MSESKLSLFDPTPSVDVKAEDCRSVEASKFFDRILEMTVVLPENFHNVTPSYLMQSLSQVAEFRSELFDISAEAGRKVVDLKNLLSLKKSEVLTLEAQLFDKLATVGKTTAAFRKTARTRFLGHAEVAAEVLSHEIEEWKLIASMAKNKASDLKDVAIQLQTVSKVLERLLSEGGDPNYTAGPPSSPSSKQLSHEIVGSELVQSSLDRLMNELAVGVEVEKRVPSNSVTLDHEESLDFLDLREELSREVDRRLNSDTSSLEEDLNKTLQSTDT